MGKQKFDRVKLSRMLREGKSQKDIAKAMNVSEAAICKAKKELNINVVKTVGLEQAHRVVDENLDIIGQLNRINEATIKIMDELVGEDQAIDRIAKAVETILQYKDEPEKQKAYIKRIILQLSQDKKLALEAGDRVLNQLKFQKEMFKDMVDIRVVAEFQRTVVDIIGKQHPKVRDEIVKNLKEHYALRQSVRIS